MNRTTARHRSTNLQSTKTSILDRILCREPEKQVLTDEKTRVLIFGVTGMIGGSVMQACINRSAWIEVVGFVRDMDDDLFLDVLQEQGVIVQNGDMSNYNSIVAAMKDIDVVFLNTHFWETMSVEKELQQGRNVVNAAMAKGIRHLIYAGTDYSPLVCEEKCGFLEAKAKIETYIVNSGIPYTIVHMGFLFENLLGVFKPHCTADKQFAIAFPMENVGLNAASVLDVGSAVALMTTRSPLYVYKTVKLAAEYLTVKDFVNVYNDILGDTYRFYDPKISLAEYRTLSFEGSDELSTMWLHYYHNYMWPQEQFKLLCPYFFTFRTFVQERKNRIVTQLKDDIHLYLTSDEPLFASSVDDSVWTDELRVPSSFIETKLTQTTSNLSPTPNQAQKDSRPKLSPQHSTTSTHLQRDKSRLASQRSSPVPDTW